LPPSLFGSPISAESAGTTYVVVNVFDGGPKTRVRYSNGGRSPIDMRRIRRPDPFVKPGFSQKPPDQEILGQGRALLAHLDGASPRPISSPARIAPIFW
jgi:hypothetical protein